MISPHQGGDCTFDRIRRPYKSEAMSLRGVFFCVCKKSQEKSSLLDYYGYVFLAGDGFVTGSVLLLIKYTQIHIIIIIYKNETKLFYFHYFQFSFPFPQVFKKKRVVFFGLSLFSFFFFFFRGFHVFLQILNQK